ncbi:CbtA family protein [Profundibacter sp.]
MFTSALFAGLIAGLIAVLLQWSLVEHLTLEGEEYETGNKTHFGGVLKINEAAGEVQITTPDETVEAEDGELTTRLSLTFFATIVTFIGWSLFMNAGFAVAERFGQIITMKDALLWGIAGFASVHLMTGIGLPPELPGTPAEDIELRQLWWITTAISSALAFALFAYGRTPVFIAVGFALLLAPHLIGAPHLSEYAGLAPPELSGEYVARSLAVGMMSWVVLGLAAGYFWNRGADTQSA